MEKRRTIFDYASQVLITFGFTMLVMNLFCILIGDNAQGVSSLFELGGEGLSTAVVFEFFCVAVLIVFLRTLFFTDICIKQMGLVPRTACMVVSTIVVISVFIVLFGWFPVGLWQAWALFLLSFAASFVLSLAVMILKEKAENRQMELALERLKQEEK